MAHSRARREWPEPSTPTMIPGISVLLLLELPAAFSPLTLGPHGPPRQGRPVPWPGTLVLFFRTNRRSAADAAGLRPSGVPAPYGSGSQAGLIIAGWPSPPMNFTTANSTTTSAV